jgi:DNA topoisomerase III
MHVLCVAEKPSIAKAVSQILSGGQFSTVGLYRFDFHALTDYALQRPTQNKYIKNYDFPYPQTRDTYTVTSVSGHLMSLDFGPMHRKWTSCDPFTLFDAPVELKVADDKKSIERNLIAEARKSQMLMIWTDCDREGENIGMEVAKICRNANHSLRVKRAKFSAIIAQYVQVRTRV